MSSASRAAAKAPSPRPLPPPGAREASWRAAGHAVRGAGSLPEGGARAAEPCQREAQAAVEPTAAQPVPSRRDPVIECDLKKGGIAIPFPSCVTPCRHSSVCIPTSRSYPRESALPRFLGVYATAARRPPNSGNQLSSNRQKVSRSRMQGFFAAPGRIRRDSEGNHEARSVCGSRSLFARDAVAGGLRPQAAREGTCLRACDSRASASHPRHDSTSARRPPGGAQDRREAPRHDARGAHAVSQVGLGVG